MQVAIEESLVKLENNDPNKKVGLVTFNHSVNVIGDGNMAELKIARDKLNSKDEIKSLSDITPDFATVKSTKKLLSQKLFKYLFIK